MVSQATIWVESVDTYKVTKCTPIAEGIKVKFFAEGFKVEVRIQSVSWAEGY